MEKLYSDEYMPRWNKLTQEWVKLLYENADKPIQRHIEKFIDPRRIDTMGYFEYFDIRHQDPKFKHLGEFIEEFDKNILKFSDLLNEVWKHRENCFMDIQRVEKEWYETKIVILNSKILENLLTTSLKTNFPEDIKKVLYPVLRHRLILTPEREMEGMTTDKVIEMIVQSVEVPR